MSVEEKKRKAVISSARKGEIRSYKAWCGREGGLVCCNRSSDLVKLKASYVDVGRGVAEKLLRLVTR